MSTGTPVQPMVWNTMMSLGSVPYDEIVGSPYYKVVIVGPNNFFGSGHLELVDLDIPQYVARMEDKQIVYFSKGSVKYLVRVEGDKIIYVDMDADGLVCYEHSDERNVGRYIYKSPQFKIAGLMCAK